MGLQNGRSLNFKNFGTLTWESWEKWHLDVASMVNHKEYYKGEGDGFPQARVVVSFGSLCMPMVH
jgi:hypothetical protein